MKQLLFVDFDGVLSHTYFWHSLKNLNHPLHDYADCIDDFLFKQNRELINEWMVGKHTSEDINQFIAENLNIPYSQLFDVFKKDCANMKISKNILKKLAELKQKYYLILATGNMDSFDRFTLPAEKELSQVFDEIHNSFNFGLLKTSNGGEYFKNVVINKKVAFDHCYLIDDSQKTCNLFESLGGKAYCTKKEDEVLDCLDLL